MAEPRTTTLNLVPAPDRPDLSPRGRRAGRGRARGTAPSTTLGRLRDLGRVAGSPRSLRWAEFVDRYPPTLRTHDPYGRRVDEVEYHPAWHRLMQAGVRAGLTAAPWAAAEVGRAAHTARAGGAARVVADRDRPHQRP